MSTKAARSSDRLWGVCAGGQVYVRTWYRRDSGWFGHALLSHSARVRVPGLAVDVTIEDVGDTAAAVTAAVDAAYRSKYDGGAGAMVTTAARATTLRLDRS